MWCLYPQPLVDDMTGVWTDAWASVYHCRTTKDLSERTTRCLCGRTFDLSVWGRCGSCLKRRAQHCSQWVRRIKRCALPHDITTVSPSFKSLSELSFWKRVRDNLCQFSWRIWREEGCTLNFWWTLGVHHCRTSLYLSEKTKNELCGRTFVL